MVTFEDFKRLDIRIGRVIAAAKVEGTDKLLRLEVDLGEKKQQLVAGIAEYYRPDEVLNKELPVLVNLESRKIKGVESQGMILAISGENKINLLHPDKEVAPGSRVS